MLGTAHKNFRRRRIERRYGSAWTTALCGRIPFYDFGWFNPNSSEGMEDNGQSRFTTVLPRYGFAGKERGRTGGANYHACLQGERKERPLYYKTIPLHALAYTSRRC